MARARNIKPSFFTNDTLAEIEPLGRLLFQGLWCHADREGRMEDRPRKLKAEILPYDDCDVEELLDGLEQRGFIARYEVGSSQFIQVVNFCKHQNPHIKEPASAIPAMPEHDSSTVQAPFDFGTGPADTLNPHPDSLNLIPDSITPTSAKPKSGYDDEFEQVWARYPSRPGASKADSFKAWKARIKEGVDPRLMADGVLRYAAYCEASQTEPKYIKQPATFFGPGRHFDSDWTATAPRAPVSAASERNRSVMSGLTRNLIGGASNVKLLGS
jgi:hypothetical protein